MKTKSLDSVAQCLQSQEETDSLTFQRPYSGHGSHGCQLRSILIAFQTWDIATAVVWIRLTPKSHVVKVCPLKGGTVGRQWNHCWA